MARNDTAEPRRVVLQRQLALVLRDIAASAGRIAKQQEIIAKLDAGGRDTTEAVRKLANFERVHALRIASHRRIIRELRSADQVSPLSLRRPGRVHLRARKVYSPH